MKNSFRVDKLSQKRQAGMSDTLQCLILMVGY